jgi:hypothetical protein
LSRLIPVIRSCGCCDLAVCSPGSRWFDVALWRRFPSLWPEWTGRVVAEHAYWAVVQLMAVYGLSSVAHAAAIAEDGSIAYRANGVRGVACGLVWFAGRGSAVSAVPAAGEPGETWSASN